MDYNDWLEEAWLEYHRQYLDFCNSIGHQADIADFIVWLEDNDLVPEPIDV